MYKKLKKKLHQNVWCFLLIEGYFSFTEIQNLSRGRLITLIFNVWSDYRSQNTFKIKFQAEQTWQRKGLSLCWMFESRGWKNTAQCSAVLQMFFNKFWDPLIYFLIPNPSSSANVSRFPCVTQFFKYK